MSQDLLDRVLDASRFIRYYRHAIESSPLQVYSSGLVFSPTQSTTRTCYQKVKPDWILNSPVVDERWSLCLQALEGHSDLVTSISWSPDGSRLASASDDKTVRIWDPATGQCVSTHDIYSLHLQFDKNTPTNLHTIIGTLNVRSTEPVAPSASRLTLPGIYGFGLSDSSSWITFNGSTWQSFHTPKLKANGQSAVISLFPQVVRSKIQTHL